MGIRWQFFWNRSNNYIQSTFCYSRHHIPRDTSNERIRLLIYRSSFAKLLWQKPWRLSWHLSRYKSRYCRHSWFFRKAPDVLQHRPVKRRLPWPTSVHCLMTLLSVRHSRKTPGPAKRKKRINDKVTRVFIFLSLSCFYIIYSTAFLTRECATTPSKSFFIFCQVLLHSGYASTRLNGRNYCHV